MSKSSIVSLRGVSDKKKASKDSLAPAGTLTKFGNDSDPDDASWQFTGDGESSGTDVMERVIEIESENDANDTTGIKAVQDNRAFAELTAMHLLHQTDPYAPLIRDQVYEFSLKSMLGLIAPFLQQYALKQQASLGNQPASSASSSAQQDAMIGNVPAAGLILPID